MSNIFSQNKVKILLNVNNLLINMKDKLIHHKSNEEEFFKTLKEAHFEWKEAENYFQNVTDPDLIDFAIYNMEAAKTKYIYLLKEARKKGIKTSV
ncbi:YaaL family protein [Caloranaerobacter sp. DY30410]|uniref:YaaL family protein n=1 Tax=Caloranaerobacter sp. DY30410 TaxID=3238305 RepID=UPI003CFCC14D